MTLDANALTGRNRGVHLALPNNRTAWLANCLRVLSAELVSVPDLDAHFTGRRRARLARRARPRRCC